MFFYNGKERFKLYKNYTNLSLIMDTLLFINLWLSNLKSESFDSRNILWFIIWAHSSNMIIDCKDQNHLWFFDLITILIFLFELIHLTWLWVAKITIIYDSSFIFPKIELRVIFRLDHETVAEPLNLWDREMTQG